ncbi:MAG TPA: hypothetical protein VIM53_03030 [Candidatus Saccharimonadales bacterium]
MSYDTLNVLSEELCLETFERNVQSLAVPVTAENGFSTAQPNGIPDEAILRSQPCDGAPGFYGVPLTHWTLATLANYVMLLHDSKENAFKPTIVTPSTDPAFPNHATVTRIESPYGGRGLGKGQHAATSISAQTRAPGFGSHNSNVVVAGEPGHFGSLLIGARDQRFANELIARGDAAADGLLSSGPGITGAMSSRGLSNVPSRTMTVDLSHQAPMLYWHERMVGEDGTPVKPDHPNAVKLLLGGAMHVLGQRGVDDAKRLTATLTQRSAYGN